MGENSSQAARAAIIKMIEQASSTGAVAVFRGYGLAVGLYGAPGGWIRYVAAPDATPLAHGWLSLARKLLGGQHRELLDAMVDHYARTTGAPAEPARAGRLNFRPAAGLTPTEATGGHTAYEAEAEGVKYRVIGSLIPGRLDGARHFRAYRVTGTTGHSLHPAGRGETHRTRASAYQAAEADLADVLRDRAAAGQDAPESAPAPRVIGMPAWYKPAVAEAARQLAASDAGPQFQPGDRVYPRSGGEVVRVRAVAEIEGSGGRQQFWPNGSLIPIHSDEYKLADSTRPDPATEDNVQELFDRVARRIKYETLKAFLTTLAADAEHYGGGSFSADDIRDMVNTTAREIGTARPWRVGQ